MDHERQTRKFYELIWPYRADVLRVAQYLSHSRVEAEDLAQEALLKAFKGCRRLEPGPGVKAWLLQILRNTWLDRLRVRAARPTEHSFSDGFEDPAIEAAPEISASEAWGDPLAVLETFSDQQVIAALQSIPEEIRWTLLLVDVEGLGLCDAARVLNVPEGTIKSRAHRGRRMLREKLLPVAKELRWVPDHANDPSSPMEEA